MDCESKKINPGQVQRLAGRAIVALILLLAAVTATSQDAPGPDKPVQVRCASEGPGYLKARIAGAVTADIDWKNQGTECTGEARPNGGVRMSFKNRLANGSIWLVVFGIPGLQEGHSARALAANVTLVHEGHGEFYSTQGTDKCTIDSIRQQAIKAAPHRERSWRVVARGFCTEPARALKGDGSVLISRFDFAGIIRFEEDDPSPPAAATDA